jgi:hypothetical protein
VTIRKIRSVALIVFTVAASIGAAVKANETSPSPPGRIISHFPLGRASYVVDLRRVGNRYRAEIKCNGATLFNSEIKNLQDQYLTGSVVGLDLTVEAEDWRKCQPEFTLGVYLHDGYPTEHREYGISDGRIVSYGQ